MAYYLEDKEYQKSLVTLIAQGNTAKQAAILMGISFKTVEAHLWKIRNDYHANNPAHLVHIFHQQGLID